MARFPSRSVFESAKGAKSAGPIRALLSTTIQRAHPTPGRRVSGGVHREPGAARDDAPNPPARAGLLLGRSQRLSRVRSQSGRDAAPIVRHCCGDECVLPESERGRQKVVGPGLQARLAADRDCGLGPKLCCSVGGEYHAIDADRCRLPATGRSDLDVLTDNSGEKAPTVTAATAPDPLPAPSNVPDIGHRPDYRDRVRYRYTTAAGERIEKARAAAAELGQTDPVPWEDIRAVYARPERTPWESYKAAAKEATQHALTVALTIGMVGIFLVALVMGNMKQQAADEARKTAPAGTTPVVKEITTSKEETRIVTVCGIFLILVFVKSAHGRVSTRRKLLAEGYLRDGEQVVTEALDALPALAELSSAPVGRKRAEALTDVHAKISALMTAVTASTETAAGITGYAGDRPRLKEHGQKVRRAFADRLGGLVEDREGTARQHGTDGCRTACPGVVRNSPGCR